MTQIVLKLTNNSTTGTTVYSTNFDDVYYSKSGALAQAQQVFLAGCNLPHNWRNLTSYCILESGFGLGLNMLTTWHNWQADQNRCQQLHFVSIEKYPLTKQQLSQVLTQLAEYKILKPQVDQLLQKYPSVLLPGIQRLNFPLANTNHYFSLTLAIGDIAQVLPQLKCQANSLFLDGFSPTKNPQMWQAKTLKLLTKQLQPKAQIATWCVAKQVRQALIAAGCSVKLLPGLAPKRNCLSATYLPQVNRPIANTKPNKILIVGAGIAGVACAYAFAKRNWQVQLFDQQANVATQASAVPLALAAPYFSADDNYLSQLTRAGLLYLQQIINQIKLAPQYFQLSGAKQILRQAYRQPNTWNNEDLTNWIKPLNKHKNSIYWIQALHLDMQNFVRHWLNQCPNITTNFNQPISQLKYVNQHWQLWHKEQLIASAPYVILANALNSINLAYPNQQPIQLQAVRGQMLFGNQTQQNLLTKEELAIPINGNGHFIPALTKQPWLWGMGSSFEPNDIGCDIRESSTNQIFAKLQLLAPNIANKLQEQFKSNTISAFANVRATCSDHFPLVGPAIDMQQLAQIPANKWQAKNLPKLNGLSFCSGFGARGLTLAPICAELLASQICQQPLPLSTKLVNVISPSRFVLRQAK